jgi:hypothetical protein
LQHSGLSPRSSPRHFADGPSRSVLTVTKSLAQGGAFCVRTIGNSVESDRSAKSGPRALSELELAVYVSGGASAPLPGHDEIGIPHAAPTLSRVGRFIGKMMRITPTSAFTNCHASAAARGYTDGRAYQTGPALVHVGAASGVRPAQSGRCGVFFVAAVTAATDRGNVSTG